MTLEQLIDKYSKYIDDLRFEDLNKALVNTEEIFKIEDGVIDQLNQLILEETGLHLLYEAEHNDHYVIIKNQYCHDLCSRKDSPFVYSYKQRVNPQWSALALFNELVDSNIHALFDYTIDSDNDLLDVDDIRDLTGDDSKVKYFDLALEYSGGRFQIELFLGFYHEDSSSSTQHILCVKELDINYGYGFSKNNSESDKSEYAINDTDIKKVMDQINNKLIQVLK